MLIDVRRAEAFTHNPSLWSMPEPGEGCHFNLPWFSFSKFSVTLHKSPYLGITESPDLLGHDRLSQFPSSFCSGSLVWSLPARLRIPTPLWPSTWLAGWILLTVILEPGMHSKFMEIHSNDNITDRCSKTIRWRVFICQFKYQTKYYFFFFWML